MFIRNPSLAGKVSQRVKSERRMAADAPDYPSILDPERLFKKFTLESFWLNGTNENHVIEIYPAKRARRDQFRVMLDGKLWHMKIGRTALSVELRKLL